ncbi:MAG: hypothetical protein Kow00121_68260 [Elainellaceae cyanobacterium]
MAEIIPSEKSPQEQEMEEERIQDVYLLLQYLIQNEQTTLKIIIDCLYDVGSVNLINQKFPRRPLNGIMKWIAQFSKPVFKIVALRWVKRNCPRLITNWLHKRVSFNKPVEKQVKQIQHDIAKAEVPETQTKAELEAERLSVEVQQLRSQLKVLSGIAIAAIATLGGMLVWLVYSPQSELLQPAQKVRSTAVDRLP